MRSLPRWFAVLVSIVAFVPFGLRADDIPETAGKSGEAPQVSGAEKRLTFVIVHGAWAGGWEHKKLAEALIAKGHAVVRVTLTGQGERVHLASPEITLDTHIQDVENVLLWEQLTDVVLVGHSYGGMVITGVVDKVPERFKRVIYLDAFLPENGESLYSSLGREGPSTQPADGFVSLGNVDLSKEKIPHIVRQSNKTFNQPISLTNQEAARKVPTSYILTVDAGKTAESDGFFRFYERAKARGWQASIMEGSHVVHLDRTRETAELLLKVAED